MCFHLVYVNSWENWLKNCVFQYNGKGGERSIWIFVKVLRFYGQANGVTADLSDYIKWRVMLEITQL